MMRIAPTNRRSGFRAERGSAIVELVAVLPVLALVLVGATDFGRVFYTSMAVGQAAHAGAEFAAASTENAGNATAVRAAALAAADSDVSTITIAFPESGGDARTCECATDAGVFRDTACASPTCTASEHQVTTVTVTAQSSFSTISAYPGVPRLIPISRTVKIRVQ
jgi:Flp pilus assembly protein TadG